MLMEWAMEAFGENGVTEIEVKVIAGNDAVGFYEKFGFKVSAHILTLRT